MYRLNSQNADIQLIVDGAWANESLLILDVVRPPELLQFVDDVIPILHGERTFASHHNGHGER